jgi:hypothetical protein
MVLDRNGSLVLISALALGIGFGCSSKKNGDDTAGTTGGASAYCADPAGCGAAGAGTTGGASANTVDPNYCGGLLSGLTCGQTKLQADIRTVNMLLAIDESGSMADPPSATSTQSKWSEMTQALTQALPKFENDINFGLELFPFDPSGDIDPSSPDSSCTVAPDQTAISFPIDSGATHLQDIIAFVRNRAPAGGTPTAKALQQAYAYYVQGAGKDLKGSKLVLLATDGGPNCNAALQCDANACTYNMDNKCSGGGSLNCCQDNAQAPQNHYNCLDDQSVITQITNLNKMGIGTYVIGIPGSEVYAATLDAMAVAGGVPNTTSTTGHSYFAVSKDNALKDLQSALDGIITQLVKSCDIALNDSPLDVSTVQVVQDCTFIPPLPQYKAPTADSGVQDGFYVDYSTSPAHLIITGSYCDRLMMAGANHLDVIEGCIGTF